MGRMAVMSVSIFKRIHLTTTDVPARVQHTGDGGIDVFFELGICRF